MRKYQIKIFASTREALNGGPFHCPDMSSHFKALRCGVKFQSPSNFNFMERFQVNSHDKGMTSEILLSEDLSAMKAHNNHHVHVSVLRLYLFVY